MRNGLSTGASLEEQLSSVECLASQHILGLAQTRMRLGNDAIARTNLKRAQMGSLAATQWTN